MNSQNILCYTLLQEHISPLHTPCSTPLYTWSTPLHNNRQLLSALSLKSGNFLYMLKNWPLQVVSMTFLCVLQQQDSGLETVLKRQKQWWPKTPMWMQNLLYASQRRWRKQNFSFKNSPNAKLSMPPCSSPTMGKTWWL